MSIVTITSNSGSKYTFKLFDPSNSWKEEPGIYMFLKPVSSGKMKILYIGQTENFRQRPLPPAHPNWNGAKQLGATAVGTIVIDNTEERLNLEVELIRRFKPPLNIQHRGSGDPLN